MLSRDSRQMLQLRVTESLTQLATAFHLSTVYICLSASIQLLYILQILCKGGKQNMMLLIFLYYMVCNYLYLNLGVCQSVMVLFMYFCQKQLNIEQFDQKHIKILRRIYTTQLSTQKCMSNFSQYSPEQDFVDKFQNMAEMLAQDNYQNMKNLNYSNHNFNQIFTYLKSIIKQIVASYRELANRTIQLENQLAKKDPYNILLLEKTKTELSFGEAAIRLSAFAPHASKKLDSFAQKTQNNMETPSAKKSKSLSDRQLLREEFDFIEQFINTNLRESLVADHSKTKTIPKNIIMNLYLRWSSLRGRKVLATKAKIVKTKITQELKRLFPRMDHNQNKYRGIAFKQDIVYQPEPTEDEVITQDQIPELQIEPHQSFEYYEGEDFAFSDAQEK